MSDPEVAVVIATRDREQRLAFALEALAAQSLPAERFEVVVVRAAGARGPHAEPPPGLRVRFLDSDHAAPAAQRNEGWRATSAPLVAFTDDDCRPEPGWLEELLAAAVPGAVVQGRTAADPAEAHLLYGLARTIEVSGPTPWGETCNIAYPRELMERLCGFDESFPRAWGEDTDLFLRAREAGATLEFAPGAVVRHAVVRRTLRQAIREAARYDAIPLLVARHPEHRRTFPAPGLVKTSHATLVLAFAGALAARRRPVLGVALGAPYVLAALRTHLATNPVSAPSLARLALHLPAPVAVETAEVIATVRGAIRNRVAMI